MNILRESPEASAAGDFVSENGKGMVRKFVLLHHYRKKTQKTPRFEIEKAKSEMRDYKARHKKKGESRK